MCRNTKMQRTGQCGASETLRPSGKRRRLTKAEVETAFRSDSKFPPFLSLRQAAGLSHLAPGTLKRLVSEGYFGNSVKRGKPVTFWRDRFVVELMELDNARKRKKNSK